MFKEEGVVVDVLAEGKVRVAVSAPRHDQCGACNLCKRDPDKDSLFLDVRSPAQLKIGDRVRVEIPGPGAALGSFLLFLLPVVLFVAGIITGEALRARGVIALGSWVSVIAGFALMAVAYAALSYFDRRLRRSASHQPRIAKL